MATGGTEKRTLSIVARLVDLVTKPLHGIERAMVGFGRIGAGAVRSVVAHLGSAKTAILGLVTAWAGLRGIAAVREIADQADALGKLAQTTGDTVENLSELEAVFRLAGVESGRFANVLRALGNAQRAATEDAGGDMAQSFADLGVTLRDLQTLGPSQLFEKIAAGLEGFNTEQERAIALGKILPKDWQALAPAVSRGVASFRQQVELVREAGATVTEEQARLANELGDAVSLVQISLQSVGRELVVAFGPSTAAALKRIAKAIAENRQELVQIAKAIGEGILRAISLAIDGLIGFVRVIESLPFVSLIDEDKLRKETAAIREQLALIEEARKPGTAVAAAQTRLETNKRASSYDMLREVAAAGEVARAAEKERQKILETLVPQEDELRARLQALETTLTDGIAGAMQKSRESLASQLRDAATAIRTGQEPPRSADESAAAFGLPTLEQWQGYADGVGKVLGRVRDIGRSVFRDTKGKAKLPDPEGEVVASGNDGKANEAETARLATLRQIASIGEQTRATRLELLELDRSAALLELREAARKGILNLSDYQKAVERVNGAFDRLKQQEQGGFGVGFSRGIARLKSEAEDFATTAGLAFGELATGAVDGFSDSFADVITGTKSAKEALKDYARQFLADVARMIAKLIVLGTIKSIFGLETGGVMPGSVDETMPLRTFERGGIVRRPTLAVFGEGKASRGEAFVPLPDGRTIPVTMSGGGGGSVTHVSITSWDSKDTTRALLENRSLLNGITQNGIETRNGFRQIVRRTAG